MDDVILDCKNLFTYFSKLTKSTFTFALHQIEAKDLINSLRKDFYTKRKRLVIFLVNFPLINQNNLLYYRQLSADSEMKTYKIKSSLVGPEGLKPQDN